MPEPIEEAHPAGPSPLVGAAVSRIDGPQKVCGTATYSYEHAVRGKAAHGFLVGATIAKGRVVNVDVSRAERAPGVLLVMTHRNAPPQAPFGPAVTPNRFERPRPCLASDAIQYYGEPVAFVVAETFEQARAAAGLVSVDYDDAGKGAFDLQASIPDAYRPEIASAGRPADSEFGDVEAGWAAAAVKVEATYTTGYQHHNAMEPHASVAFWAGEELTVYTGTQIPVTTRGAIAATLTIPKEKVRVVSAFSGGGFGNKLPTEADVILSALAARILRRPVKTAMTRQQTFQNTAHRGASVQKIRLAADRTGALSVLQHDVWGQTATFDEYIEQTASYARSLYAAPNRLTRHRGVRLDLPMSGPTRAPGEAPGSLAFECAMDELAHALRMDPIALRLRNEPATDPEKGIPFATRNLVACLREGARRFGWDQRPSGPGRRREGDWLIGCGVAVAFRPNQMRNATARATIDRTGLLTVETSATDIGTGTYTILAQVAAETMGVGLHMVQVRIGDTSLPPSPGSGGSSGASSSTTAVQAACLKLRAQIAESAVADARSPLGGAQVGAAQFRDGQVYIGNRREAFADIAARRQGGRLEAEATTAPPETYKTHSQHAYGAHFAEVAINADTGEARVRRMLGVFTVGRVLNAKTARSQMIGGMIWGISSALHEESIVDRRYGHFVNRDLAGYHLPTHADVPAVEAIFLPEVDPMAGPMGVKGLGELGICGAGASVANAVFNATGVRVRDFPITLDKLLPGLPVAGDD